MSPDLLLLAVVLAGEGAVSLLTDHLDGDLVEVLRPEPKPDLATDPGPQELAHGVLGGEGLWERVLLEIRTHEDKDPLHWVGETDDGVVLQRNGGPPSHFGPIHPGT